MNEQVNEMAVPVKDASNGSVKPSDRLGAVGTAPVPTIKVEDGKAKDGQETKQEVK